MGQRPCAELEWAVMALPGTQLLGLGVGLCYVGRRCSLAGVRAMATTVWLAQCQWAGGFVQDSAGWFLFVHVRYARGSKFRLYE